MSYWKWLQTKPHSEPLLSWCLTISSDDFQKAINKNAYDAIRCEVANKDLIYLSYGRPIITPSEKGKRRRMGSLPVALLFRTSICDDERDHIYPFDSRAFKSDTLSGFFVDNDIEKYRLETSPISAAKHVKAHFGTNAGYFNLSPRRATPADDGTTCVQAVIELVRRFPEGVDDSVLAVELQRSRKLVLDENDLLAVIHPDELTSEAFKSYKKSKAQKGVNFIRYEADPYSPGYEYRKLLGHLAHKFQKRKNG